MARTERDLRLPQERPGRAGRAVRAGPARAPTRGATSAPGPRPPPAPASSLTVSRPSPPAPSAASSTATTATSNSTFSTCTPPASLHTPAPSAARASRRASTCRYIWTPYTASSRGGATPRPTNTHTISLNSRSVTNRRLCVTGAALAGGVALGYRPQCPLCGRVYSSTSNLRQHMLNVHSQTDRDQWFPCQHCGKKCKTKHYLINHQLQAHGIRQRQNS